MVECTLLTNLIGLNIYIYSKVLKEEVKTCLFLAKVFFTFLFWTKINVQNRFAENTFGKTMLVLTMRR